MAKRNIIKRYRKRASTLSRVQSWIGFLILLSSLGTFLYYKAYVWIGLAPGQQARIFAAYADLELKPDTLGRLPESPSPPTEKPASEPWRRITRVLDGDTLEVDGERVRLIGIDTPESSLNNELYRDVGRMGGIAKAEDMLTLGKEASHFTRRLATGKRCWLEYETSRTDQYGRTLAYVHLEDGMNLGETILYSGYAKAYLSFNFRYKKRYVRIQTEAMARRHGFWAGE